MLTALLAGCATDAAPADPTDAAAVDGQNGACTALEGQSFSSVEELECGQGPGGISRCHWRIELSALDAKRSTFTWRYSDVGESGAVRCTGRRLATDGFGLTHTGAYDPATRQLVWEDVPYTLE